MDKKVAWAWIKKYDWTTLLIEETLASGTENNVEQSINTGLLGICENIKGDINGKDY